MDKDNERILLANVIGECIKSLQLDKNINQKELALLSGVSERSLRRIERGQVNVNVYVLRQLVMALGEEMPDFWRIVGWIFNYQEYLSDILEFFPRT